MASGDQIKALLKGLLWDDLADLAKGLSYAEVAGAANEALKDALIHERDTISPEDIRSILAERRRAAGRLIPQVA